MSSQYALKMTDEQAREMPMVDLAFQVLKAANTPFYYRDLMMEIAKIKEMSDDDVMQVIAQLYTEINIDGRFACVGTNLWGLKRWYPVEKAEDAISGGSKRPRIINDEDDDLDDEDLYAEDDAYVSDEDYEAEDAESDELYADDEEVDEVEEVEDEVVIEGEELDDEDSDMEEEDLEEDAEEDSGDEDEDDDN